MPVKSDAVGRATEPVLLEVTTRLTEAYAAGLGDTNQRYLDDAARKRYDELEKRYPRRAQSDTPIPAMTREETDRLRALGYVQ